MKAVLLPIWPQYCELIANGKKTVEVRKTRPKLETPFKCYIYCTACKSFYSIGCIRYGEDELYRIPNGKIKYGTSVELMGYDDGKYGPDNFLNRKVIGEFVCDRIIEFDAPGGLYRVTPNFIEKECCLSMPELQDYGYDAKTNSYKNLYGWHISDLVIYDKPKELSEFHRPCTPACNYSEECGGANATDCLFGINKAPQAWRYVEVVA